MDLKIPVDTLLSELWTQQGYPYQSIRILLLGLSGDDAARREIQEFMDRTADWDRAQNLGAFATALVELDGVAGVTELDRILLSDARQPLDKLEQVVEALAIHSGVGSSRLKEAVQATLERLVQTRPDAAPLVARQFGSREDWTLAGPLATLVEERSLISASDLMTVAVYVAQAKAAIATEPGDVARDG